MLKVNHSQKTVVVLGFPRSATSLVAKGLSNEISLGDDLLKPDENNPQGYYESWKFIRLNEEILKASGGSWSDPPSVESILEQEIIFVDKIKQVLAEESKGKKIWGWKDPRTTLTIPIFYPYLKNPHFVCCFRKPEDASRSLNRIDASLSCEKMYHLASVYNERLISFITNFVKQ